MPFIKSQLQVSLRYAVEFQFNACDMHTSEARWNILAYFWIKSEFEGDEWKLNLGLIKYEARRRTVGKTRKTLKRKPVSNLFLIDLSFLVRVSGYVAGIFVDIHYSCIANISDSWLQERLIPSFLLHLQCYELSLICIAFLIDSGNESWTKTQIYLWKNELLCVWEMKNSFDAIRCLE